MDAQPPSTPPEQPITEEELRAAYEEQLRRVRVADVLIQTLVSLLNVGARKAGLAGAPEEKDLEQARQAIEGARALLPLVEDELGPDLAQLRDVLSQLQLAYAREAPAGPAPGGEGAAAQPPDAGRTDPSGPGPAESSGRLWVPGR